MKKIISYSLWGDNKKYTIGAIKNAELQKIYFPDWKCRFYVDENTVPLEIINTLISQDAEIIRCSRGNWSSMFWRFYAAEDADIMLSRDCDSRLSEREQIAVDEWLSSSKDFHIIRDHPAHAIQILGGLWGTRNGLISNIRELLDVWISKNKRLDYWQVDQFFLRDIVYPIVINRAFIHDEFFNYEPNRNKIKHIRIDGEHLGGVFDENGNPNYQHRAAIKG
jgi:hypothetical protein